MVQALNALHYDVWVPGNHDFNFGMDVTEKTVHDMDATVLAGNVYDASGDSLGAGYAIFDVGGVRVAVIGMVTPLIARWDAANLADCTVTDPLDETRKIIDAIALFTPEANLYPGDIRKCDMSLIYKYGNTLYTLRMTGAQLKKYMEWSANYYNTFRPGDLTVSFNPEVRAYNYDMFAGVRYEVNIANEPGSRIEHLTWPDGTPVQDDDVFLLAANNYRATTHLLAPGEIFDEGDLPELVEMDVRGELGGIRELIGDYIVHVKGGTIHPECDESWRITGIDWDEAKRQKAVELLREGKLTIPASPDGRTANVRPVTEDDLK